jgi:formate C-acetyltransferase
LPDAYGRGRIIGDYRPRPRLYGVNRSSLARRKRKGDGRDGFQGDDEIIRDREELAEQIRALEELREMAASYGFDISGPARNAGEAVQWLYFRLSRRSQGAERRRDVARADVDLPRRLLRARSRPRVLTEEQAQEIIDDFVIKLRIVRFLRTPEYDELFAGDPTWVTESIGGMGDDGRSLVTKTSFRLLQTLYNLGPAPEPNLTIWYSPRLPDGFRRFARGSRSTPARSSSRTTRSCGAAGRRRRDRLLCLADAAGKADAVLRRAHEPREVPALRDQRRPRRDQRRADCAGFAAVSGDLLDFDDVLGRSST